MRMGAVCRAPTWVTNAASSTIENGAATTAPGTAESRQVNASPSGKPGMTWWTMTPAVPPMNSDGKIGPPTKPLPWLTAKVSIFAMSVATTRPRPRVPAPLSTVLSWSLPLNMVSGSATPTIPKTTPIRTQNSRFWVTGGAAVGSGVAVTTGNTYSRVASSLATGETSPHLTYHLNAAGARRQRHHP